MICFSYNNFSEQIDNISKQCNLRSYFADEDKLIDYFCYSVKEKRSKQVFTAYGKVHSLLETNKKAIVSILNYEGVGVSEDMTDEAITARTQVFFENEDNIENFLDTVEKYEKDNVFKDELLVMDVIRHKRGLRVLQKEGREYFLMGKSLGTTDRQVASKIAKDDALYEEFLRLTAG